MTLQVDTDIPYGNACDYSIEYDGAMPVVGFAADPHGGPEVLWFCFHLTQSVPENANSPFKLLLKHQALLLGGHDATVIHPVVRYSGSDWQRIAAGTQEKTPDGRLQASWVLEQPATSMEIALCYPYGMPDIDRLITDTGGFWHADTIGVSQAARPLVRLSNSYGEVPGSRPGCYFIARQHSGETSGSWVLDGLLRQLASYGSDAPIIWAVPFANIDGVEQGDYGKDNFPYDLNRAWDASNPMRHEVMVIQRDMYRWKARCQPLIALDFHAPGACETTGVYCYLPRGEMDRNFAVAINGWAERLKLAIGDMAAADFARIGNYPSRWETPHFNNFCTAKLGMHSLSLETPYCRINEIVLQREHYQRIGANIADSLVGKIKEE